MEVPSHRACAHCRSQKVRCLPEESNPNICQRCARTGRPCVFTPVQKRKQRKRTDTRVAELEREMRAMRALLKEKNDGSSPEETGNLESEGETMQEDARTGDDESYLQGLTGSLPAVHTHSELAAAGREVLQAQQTQQSTTHTWARGSLNIVNGRKLDVVDRGIISPSIHRSISHAQQTSFETPDQHCSWRYLLPEPKAKT
jgi:hypothetical protein